MDDLKEVFEKSFASEKESIKRYEQEEGEKNQQALTKAFSDVAGLVSQMGQAVAGYTKTMSIPLEDSSFYICCPIGNRRAVQENEAFQNFKSAAIELGYCPIVKSVDYDEYQDKFDIDLAFSATVSGRVNRMANSIKKKIGLGF